MKRGRDNLASEMHLAGGAGSAAASTPPTDGAGARRRDVLKGLLGGLALAPCAVAATRARRPDASADPAQAGEAATARALTVVSDGRLALSLRWAAAMQGLGGVPYLVDAARDALWSGRLHPVLGDRPGCWLSGRTGESLYLCIQQLAVAEWYGARVAIRHRLSHGGWTHHVHAPSAMAAPLRHALGDRLPNDPGLARVFLQASPIEASPPQIGFVVESPRHAAPEELDGTTTWLLVPVRA